MKKDAVLQSFGDTVRQFRHIQQLSQEELAERCGLHRTYIGSIERGERNVALVNILKIAKALNIAPGQLMDGLKLE